MTYLEKVDQLQAEIDCLTRERNFMLSKLQINCEHPIHEVREVDYIPNEYGSCTLPFRVCLQCGYAEEGWGCGYWRLRKNDKIAGMGRKIARKYIKTFLTQNQMNEKQREQREQERRGQEQPPSG